MSKWSKSSPVYCKKKQIIEKLKMSTDISSDPETQRYAMHNSKYG